MSTKYKNKILIDCLYLDDVYCTNHETDPSFLEVYFDDINKIYGYILHNGCKDKNEFSLENRKDFVEALAKLKPSIISGYPEISSKYDDMISKVKKYK